jgi:hypothetical protein
MTKNVLAIAASLVLIMMNVWMLVLEEADGSVSIAWTDVRYIAKRFGITDHEAQFTMASDVAASMASAATK